MGVTEATSDESLLANWVVDIEAKAWNTNMVSQEELLWKKASIYKVPAYKRELNPRAFTPVFVSFGPFHYDDPELKKLEVHKERALVHFLKKTNRSLQNIKYEVAKILAELRDAYCCLDDRWKTNDEEFLKMMILDGCFTLEILQIYEGTNDERGYSDYDPYFSREAAQHKLSYIRRDMLLIENQLPLLLLKTLAQFLNLNCQGPKDINRYINRLVLNLVVDNGYTTTSTTMGLHALDLFRHSLLGSEPQSEPFQTPSQTQSEIQSEPSQTPSQSQSETQSEPSQTPIKLQFEPLQTQSEPSQTSFEPSQSEPSQTRSEPLQTQSEPYQTQFQHEPSQTQSDPLQAQSELFQTQFEPLQTQLENPQTQSESPQTLQIQSQRPHIQSEPLPMLSPSELPELFSEEPEILGRPETVGFLSPFRPQQKKFIEREIPQILSEQQQKFAQLRPQSSFISSPLRPKPYCFIPVGQTPQIIIQSGQPQTQPESNIIRCAVELDEAGVRLKKSETNSLKKIKFESGKFYLPFLMVDDTTECSLLNVITFEYLHFNLPPDVTIYVTVMDEIIDSADDVRLLHNKGLILNALGSDEEVARMFNSMGKEITMHHDDNLSEIRKNVSRYCRKRRHRWRAYLISTYFRNPWTIISLAGALLVIALTIVQTVYALFDS